MDETMTKAQFVLLSTVFVLKLYSHTLIDRGFGESGGRNRIDAEFIHANQILLTYRCEYPTTHQLDS